MLRRSVFAPHPKEASAPGLLSPIALACVCSLSPRSVRILLMTNALLDRKCQADDVKRRETHGILLEVCHERFTTQLHLNSDRTLSRDSRHSSSLRAGASLFPIPPRKSVPRSISVSFGSGQKPTPTATQSTSFCLPFEGRPLRYFTKQANDGRRRQVGTRSWVRGVRALL